MEYKYYGRFATESTGGIYVSFPDAGTQTQGDTREEAIEMAIDVLELHFEDVDTLPPPFTLDEMKENYSKLTDYRLDEEDPSDCFETSVEFVPFIVKLKEDKKDGELAVEVRLYDEADQKAVE